MSEAQIQCDLVSSMVGLEQSKKDKVREREQIDGYKLKGYKGVKRKRKKNSCHSITE